MIDVVRILIAPLVWLVFFSAVYGLHGLGCALGWGAREVAGMSALRLALWLGWAVSIAAQLVLMAALRPSRLPAWARADRGPAEARFVDQLVVMMVWLGLVATVWSLLPVVATTTCGDGAAQQ